MVSKEDVTATPQPNCHRERVGRMERGRQEGMEVAPGAKEVKTEDKR